MVVTNFNASWKKTTLESNLVLIGVFIFCTFKPASFQTNSQSCLPLLYYIVYVIIFYKGDSTSTN